MALRSCVVFGNSASYHARLQAAVQRKREGTRGMPLQLAA
jgi:hypothetical protein